MKNWITLAMVLSMVTLGTVSQAAMTELNDQELSQVYGNNGIAGFITEAMLAKIRAGEAISGQYMLEQLIAVSRATGVSLENVSIISNGNSQVTVTTIRDGQVIGTQQIPSSFDRIEIGAIRVGAQGASMGSISIQNVNVTGNITVRVH